MLPQKKFLWMCFVLHFLSSLSASVPLGRDAFSSKQRGTTQGCSSHQHCRSLQLPIVLVCSLTELSRTTGCLKSNKNANVRKARAQGAFESKGCYMLLPGQDNLGHLLLNKSSTAVIVPSSISTKNNQKNLLVQGNYKTTTWKTQALFFSL